MFENIIAQSAALQLTEDIRFRRLAPSMLFFGPPASGKGSAALELARVLSCEDGASWNCACPACGRHRYLLHGDLLILGPRQFGAEIAAARSAFLREPATPAARILFIRSLRKLLARFSPVLIEDDPRAGKFGSLLQSLEEELDEFESLAAGLENREALEKITASIQKNAFRLEDEGMGELIPVAHIRRASYWSRLAPNGRRKTLLIENADHMRDEARNSLLKILEEPPQTVSIVLTAQRREALIPTLLSRLRPYRFLKRDEAREREVIRRVFRDAKDGPISAYIDSFLPQSAEKLYPLAAFFAASLARSAAVSLKKRGAGEIPAELTALGTRCGAIAEAAGLEKKLTGAREVIPAVLAGSGNFEDGSFPRFLRMILDLAGEVWKEGNRSPRSIAHNDLWRKYTAGAEAAAEIWNQSPALALESLFYRLKEALAAV